MTARLDSMTTSTPPPQPPRRVILPRWMGLIFPVVLLATVGAWIAYTVNQTIVPFALALAFSAGLGLLSGFSARWAMRRRPFPVRVLAALSAVTVGLLLLGLLTSGAAGISPAQGSETGLNLIGLIHLSVGGLTALMALTAWRVRVLPPARPSTTAPARTPRPQAQAVVSAAPFRSLSLKNRWDAAGQAIITRWQDSGIYRGLGSLGDRIRNAQLDSAQPDPRPAALLRSTSAARPKPTQPTAISPQPDRLTTRQRVRALGQSVFRWQRPSVVRMGKVAEQRCPYCFDVVRENDPRGIVVCPICRTPHHADCWAVTGMCQIPHSHT